jgi:hypothetical protein
MSIVGDGDAWVYADLFMSPQTSTGIAIGKPTSFGFSLMKNNPAYGGDATGPSFALSAPRQGGGTYVPFIVNSNGNVILAGASNAINGNVGIGTNTPGSKLVVSANAANPPAYNLADPLSPQDGTILHIVNADTQKTRVTIDSFNNTAGPSVAFRSGRGTLATPAATQSGDAVGIVYGGGFGATRFHTAAKPAMWMVATENWTDTAAGSAIFFNTVQNGTSATVERMRIGSDGNVGIGTAAPTSKLHVAGDITVDGNINAKYQDVAEWVPTTQKLAAGTVVILDVEHDNHVAASMSSYDTRVAGVVSARPGISLGEKGEGKALVATTGRVKVRVDATQGAIKVGDLLVTSDRAGYAMKSEPVLVGKRQMHSPGTIIGKALESLAGGTGEILVLLSLQ